MEKAVNNNFVCYAVCTEIQLFTIKIWNLANIYSFLKYVAAICHDEMPIKVIISYQ